MEIDRLDDVAFCAEAAALIDITVALRSGQDDNGNGECTRIGLEPAQHFDAVDLGQVEIQQDHERQGLRLSFEISAGAKQKIERLSAIARDAHRIGHAGASKSANSEFSVIRIIFHQKNFTGLGSIWFSVRLVRSE